MDEKNLLEAAQTLERIKTDYRAAQKSATPPEVALELAAVDDEFELLLSEAKDKLEEEKKKFSAHVIASEDSYRSKNIHVNYIEPKWIVADNRQSVVGDLIEEIIEGYENDDELEGLMSKAYDLARSLKLSEPRTITKISFSS